MLIKQLPKKSHFSRSPMYELRENSELEDNIVDEDTDEEKHYQIVGEAEADIERGLLNIRSPIARALIGKEEGDSVEVKTPGGIKSYEILSIRYL